MFLIKTKSLFLTARRYPLGTLWRQLPAPRYPLVFQALLVSFWALPPCLLPSSSRFWMGLGHSTYYKLHWPRLYFIHLRAASALEDFTQLLASRIIAALVASRFKKCRRACVIALRFSFLALRRSQQTDLPEQKQPKC